MAEFLLELLSEEIPARLQGRACADLERMMVTALKEARLDHGPVRTFATPRRLTIVIEGLPARQPDLREERKGPKADAPEKAIEGFLRSVGLTRDEVEEREDKKGTVLFAVIEKPGRATAEVLAEIVPEIIRTFPWPKSMRWGSGDLRWVRPLRSILALLDGTVVDFEVGGIRSGNTTVGHRFMAPDDITVSGFADYTAKLRAAHVVLDAAERQEMIATEAAKLATDAGYSLVENPALLAEVAGLVEWPVPLMGSFDAAFLDVPPEVLVTSMAEHQKFFALEDQETGRLANRFITVANIAAEDGGKKIIAGNEKVLAARLADARFFWDQDRKIRLEDRLPKLDDITFYDKLGSVGQRVERIRELAIYLARQLGLDEGQIEQVARAAQLCKADLVSQMVYEFPELQGQMGRYYALEQGEDAAVADAIRDHYAPKGPDDVCPTAPVSVAVALAEKLDTLVGFFAIDEKPTGSKDPFALRRAALGVIRLVVENGLRLKLAKITDLYTQLTTRAWMVPEKTKDGTDFIAMGDRVRPDLLTFFHDRLKVQQREAGVRHDLIDAVLGVHRDDDLVRLLARVAALRDFLDSDDGANLLAGYKRAANILKIEEKKDGTAHDGAVDPERLYEAAEITLYEKLGAAEGEARAAVKAEDFAAAMRALSSLRAPIDAFFDHVTVNADDSAVRDNRLRLLNQIRTAMHTVADFSAIQG